MSSTRFNLKLFYNHFRVVPNSTKYECILRLESETLP